MLAPRANLNLDQAKTGAVVALVLPQLVTSSDQRALLLNSQQVADQGTMIDDQRSLASARITALRLGTCGSALVRERRGGVVERDRSSRHIRLEFRQHRHDRAIGLQKFVVGTGYLVGIERNLCMRVV